MLRVDGLKTPLRKNQEEVRDVNRRAADLIHVTQCNTLMYEIKTKSRVMKQEELIKELTATMETAKKKAADFELQVKNLQADVKALGEADKENTQLRADVSRLKNELAQTQADHKAKLEAEQDRLISENERDCEERMKMALSLIYPNTDWVFFDLRYKYATEVFDAQVLGTKKSTPFEEWAGIAEEEEEEQAKEQAPGEANEAQA